METGDSFKGEFDKFRQEQFPKLCDGSVYADWAGAALPPKMLIENHCRNLCEELLGNPHSAHSPSMRAMDLIEQARSSVLRFFSADPSEYDVIFTAGATWEAVPSGPSGPPSATLVLPRMLTGLSSS